MKYFNKAFDIFLYEGVFIFLFSCLLLLLNDRYTNLFFKISISSLIIAAILWVTGYTFNLFASEDRYEEIWSGNWPISRFLFKIYFQYFLKIRNVCFSFEPWNFLKQDSNSSAAGAPLAPIGALTERWPRYMHFYWLARTHWHRMI